MRAGGCATLDRRRDRRGVESGFPRSDVAFAIVDIDVENLSRTHAARRVFHHLKANNCAYPAILRLGYDAQTARAPNNAPCARTCSSCAWAWTAGPCPSTGLLMASSSTRLLTSSSSGRRLLVCCRLAHAQRQNRIRVVSFLWQDVI